MSFWEEQRAKQIRNDSCTFENTVDGSYRANFAEEIAHDEYIEMKKENRNKDFYGMFAKW